jgi:ribosomal protein S18 acetylase RimI-like enzyme
MPGSSPPAIEITSLPNAELPAAIDLLARGMRDNPLHVAAFGNDPNLRQRKLRRLFAAASALAWREQMLVARNTEGAIVGVCGMATPGGCRPTPAQRLRLLPALVDLGLGPAVRTSLWLDAWSRRDPDEPHWHLGPIAVDTGLQGQGIGSRLMEAFCARVDAAGDAAWLETDKAINVRFYQRFGFEAVAEELVLGVPCWYMRRPPK